MSQHWQVSVWVSVVVALAPTVLHVLPVVDGRADRAYTAPSAVPEAIRAEASWIREAQRPDGAIEPEPDVGEILPYLGNYAALGLARAASELHDQADRDAAWRWLSWYQAHQDKAGFVTDYHVVDGIEMSTGTYDSTDAYAGTFLAAVAATWQADPDKARLRALGSGIGRAVAAIQATQTTDGLTWAKPGYYEQLLMDNAEVYGGLRSAAVLATALGESALAVRATIDARRVAMGVAALWNRNVGGFDWAKARSGTISLPHWTILYPDVMENVWAVAYGLASPTQARSILLHLDRQQPSWAKPDLTAASNTDGVVSQQPVGYWPIAGWALALVGQNGGALDAAFTISAGAAARQRTWPYTVGDAGELIALQSGWPGTAPWAVPFPSSGPRPGLRRITIVAIPAAAALLINVVLVRLRRRRESGWSI